MCEEAIQTNFKYFKYIHCTQDSYATARLWVLYHYIQIVKEASENEFDHLVFVEILNNKHIDLVGDCFNVILAYDDQNFVLIKIGFIVNSNLKRASMQNLNSQGHGPLF